MPPSSKNWRNLSLLFHKQSLGDEVFHCLITIYPILLTSQPILWFIYYLLEYLLEYSHKTGHLSFVHWLPQEVPVGFHNCCIDDTRYDKHKGMIGCLGKPSAVSYREARHSSLSAPVLQRKPQLLRSSPPTSSLDFSTHHHFPQL
jgi:hypothetical protein